MLKCLKKFTTDVFRGWKPINKVWRIYLAFKKLKISGKLGTKRLKKARSKVRSMFFKVEMQKAITRDFFRG